MSPETEVQFASLSAVTVYVFVPAGDTLTVKGLVAIPVTVTGVVPSEYVKLQGCVPVRATLKVVDPPLHIVAVPLVTEVGRGITVTVALPVLSPACEIQFTSLNAVTVYVVEAIIGVTLKVYGLDAIPVTVTGVVPSV